MPRRRIRAGPARAPDAPRCVGVALLYATGLSFAYVDANGATHVGPLSVIPHTYAAGDQIYITNFGGSFGLSLYSAATARQARGRPIGSVAWARHAAPSVGVPARREDGGRPRLRGRGRRRQAGRCELLREIWLCLAPDARGAIRGAAAADDDVPRHAHHQGGERRPLASVEPARHR
jgi:hypothetical protein